MECFSTGKPSLRHPEARSYKKEYRRRDLVAKYPTSVLRLLDETSKRPVLVANGSVFISSLLCDLRHQQALSYRKSQRTLLGIAWGFGVR